MSTHVTFSTLKLLIIKRALFPSQDPISKYLKFSGRVPINFFQQYALIEKKSVVIFFDFKYSRCKFRRYFFLNHKEKFDVIYVDGSHEADQVYKDIKNSWNILNINGILICDDYFYGNIYKNPNNVPSIAINKFVSEIFKNNSIEILCVNNSQIFLKKRN